MNYQFLLIISNNNKLFLLNFRKEMTSLIQLYLISSALFAKNCIAAALLTTLATLNQPYI